MEVHNRDVFPTPELRQVYEPIAGLLDNPVIDAAFRRHEAAAVRAKALYHRLGRAGMVLIMASAVFTVAEALVLPEFRGRSALSIILVMLGGLGIGLHVYLMATGMKTRWLLERFAAERLRSLKFQAYPLALAASSDTDLVARVRKFSTDETARLAAELNAGEAALRLYAPARGLSDPAAPRAPASAPLVAAALRAYAELRISYQKQFATSEVEALRRAGRGSYTAADILYLLGAGLTVAALVCKIALPGEDLASRWIDFLAVSAFILGLGQSIMDNASLSETSEARYVSYVEAIKDCETALAQDQSSFPETVRRIERIALEELWQFCQAANLISYRL
ncbi:MAG: hypothetical protein AB1942_03405 [Pseudomonadota bacterium]